MNEGIQYMTIALMIALVIMLVLLCVLAVVYFKSKLGKKEARQNIQNSSTDKTNKVGKIKEYKVASVMDFMEFDKIEDNMIIQKKGEKFVMIIECQGVNYDLMSSIEKNAVEEGFIQFLNTLRHPIQLYTQTRTINLEQSIQTYKTKIKEVEEQLEETKRRYNEMKNSPNYTKEQIEKVYYEVTKQTNLYEYGKDIIYTTEKMSLNRNVLNKRYYIAIPYYSAEIGQNSFDKEEIKNLSFSELYTRAQSVIRTLSVCGISSKILTSNEILDLLYVAYNRDESEVYGIDKALRAGYDELYTTAPDVLDKKMRELDRIIEEKAFEKANEKVIEAKSEKEKRIEQKEENMEDLIAQMAQIILAENASIIGEDIAKEATEKITKEETSKKKGGKKDVQEKTTKRKRTTKSA